MIKPLEMSIRDLLAPIIAPWTDHKGNVQPAPTVQLYEFTENALADDERCMLIRNVGSGSGNYLVREPQMMIVVMSKVAGDMQAAYQYAMLVMSYISKNYRTDCIMGLNAVGDVAGPYPLASGRRAFEINLTVITDTGEA